MEGIMEGLFENCLWVNESYQDPAERTACEYALRWGRAWCVSKNSQKRMMPEQLSQGEGSNR